MASSCTRGDSAWTLGNNSPGEHSPGELEWAAQGAGGVTVPGGVQEMLRCCTEGHGLVGSVGERWTVGLDDLQRSLPTPMIVL